MKKLIDTVRFSATLHKRMVDEVDVFQHKQRLPNRMEALRTLIRRGLDGYRSDRKGKGKEE